METITCTCGAIVPAQEAYTYVDMETLEETKLCSDCDTKALAEAE